MEVWKLAGDFLGPDGLRDTHQRRHLPVEETDCPPDFAATLYQGLAEFVDGHVGVHAVCEAYAHGLADLQILSKQIQPG